MFSWLFRPSVPSASDAVFAATLVARRPASPKPAHGSRYADGGAGTADDAVLAGGGAVSQPIAKLMQRFCASGQNGEVPVRVDVDRRIRVRVQIAVQRQRRVPMAFERVAGEEAP